MEEGRLAYRVRTAEAGDAKALRDAIGSTLAHPDHQGRRESYQGAASRGDILILEHYDRAAHDWRVAGFVECHMRVDDNLSIRDVGTTGDEPQNSVVRYLLDQAFNSYRPAGSQVKIRRDARNWLEIFEAIPGFYLEGEEYRRPHYWTIWRWDRQKARDSDRPGPRTPDGQPARLRPRPPGSVPQQPPGINPGPGRPPDRSGPPPRGPRPGGPSGPFGPRPGGPPGPSRPFGPSGPSRPFGPPRGPRPAGQSSPSSPRGSRPAQRPTLSNPTPPHPNRPKPDFAGDALPSPHAPPGGAAGVTGSPGPRPNGSSGRTGPQHSSPARPAGGSAPPDAHPADRPAGPVDLP